MKTTPFERTPNALERLIRRIVRDELAQPETITVIKHALDEELSTELTNIGTVLPPSAGQSVVAGERP